MTVLRLSKLRVSVTDRRDYWATSSEHFLHTASRTLFSTYTRLRCYPFWNMLVQYGTHKKDQLLLENVQLFAARLAIKSWSRDQNRRSYLKLIFALKVSNNLVFCPFVLFTYHPQPNLRMNHNKQLLQPFARTVSFSYSCFISTVKLWNSLPSDIVACTNLSSFKCALKDLYLT